MKTIKLLFFLLWTQVRETNVNVFTVGASFGTGSLGMTPGWNMPSGLKIAPGSRWQREANSLRESNR